MTMPSRQAAHEAGHVAIVAPLAEGVGLPTEDASQVAYLALPVYSQDQAAARSWLDWLAARADQLVRDREPDIRRLAYVLDRDGTVRGHDRIVDILIGW